MAASSRLSLQPFALKRGLIWSFRRVLHTEPSIREPAYPPIIPSRTAKSKSAKKLREEEFINQVRAAATVQEKLRLLTKFQRKKYVLYPQTFALNADRWYQHFTKTAYLPGLPKKFSVDSGNKLKEADVIDSDVFSELRSLVCNAILQENFYLKKRRPFLQREQEHFVAPFLSNMVSAVTNTLAKHNPVLKVSSLDFGPQVNFYWMRGERTVPCGHRRGRVDPVRFQIDDQPHSQLRVPQQLPEFLPLEESGSAEVPVIHFAPDLLPMFRRQYDNNIFIGSKVADPCCYGHTQFHLVGDRLRRDKLAKANLADQVEVGLRANAIASLFAWTGAQAMYQGFWSHEDVTRPFVSQAVITDGLHFSFFCYQLNTLGLTVQTDSNNPRKNVCWGTESMRLYEGVKDGDVIGWNDSVLKLLVQFLMNRPHTM
nr:PREDICTED: 28S ribosomal protein S30, mitochondrial [Lepisosteus oculatus]